MLRNPGFTGSMLPREAANHTEDPLVVVGQTDNIQHTYRLQQTFLSRKVGHRKFGDRFRGSSCFRSD